MKNDFYIRIAKTLISLRETDILAVVCLVFYFSKTFPKHDAFFLFAEKKSFSIRQLGKSRLKHLPAAK